MKKRLICLLLALTMCATQVVTVSATRKDEIKAEQQKTESQLSQAENKAANLEEQKAAVMGEISELDQNLVSVMAQIDILDGEISDKEVVIEETKVKLAKAEANRDKQYESMKKRIQYLYENGGQGAWAQMMFEADSITNMLTKAEYTEKMYKFDRDELQEMKNTVKKVTDLGNQLEDEKAELEGMKVEQEGQKANMEVALEQKKATASNYADQIASMRAQAAEYRALIEQQNAEIAEIEEEERRAAEEQRRREEEARRQQEAQQQQQQNNTNNTNNTPSNNTGNTNNNNTNNNYTEPSAPSNGGGSSSNSGAGSATGSAIVAYASQFIGNPYVYGGNSLTNGIDCSGFTQQVFAHFGYSLPRVSDAQAGAGRGISYSEARAGDIIVYAGHVAILTGDGGIVHASNSAPYPRGGIKYSPNALYRPYIAVRRIVG